MFRKIVTTGAVATAAVFMLIGGSSAAMAADGENLVANGQFDQTQFWTDNGQRYNGDKIGAWDVNAPSGNNPALKTAQVWFPGMAGEGATMAAPFPSGAWIRVMGSISQSIPTEVGKTYTLTYQSRASGSDANPLANGWKGGNGSFAAVDGVTVDTFTTVTDPLFTERTATFTATSSSTLISFGNTGGGAVGFDGIAVTEVPTNDSPLMVPALAGGLGMAALAGGVLAFTRRNKRGSE